MDSATVDSVYENLFSAQNFFAMHEQQQIDKQNSMMANNSLMDLDMFRYEDGGGDACGALLLGEDYCSGFKDDALGGAAAAGNNSSGNGSGSSTTDGAMETGTGAAEATSAVAVTTTLATTKTPSLLDWQRQSLEQQDKDKDAAMKSLNAYNALHSSFTSSQGGASSQTALSLSTTSTSTTTTSLASSSSPSLVTPPPSDCLWYSQFRPPRPAPTIQIGEEKFVLRSDTIFVLGMRLNVTKNDIIVFFGKMGHIKMDELTLKPKIFVYKNKLTGRSKGEATITYTSAYAAQAAIYYLDGSKFLGQILSVVPAYLSTRPGKSVRFSYAQDPVIDQKRRQRQKKWKPAIDNWVCELCRNSNFVWRLSCNRCRVNKSEAIAMTNAVNSSAAAAAAAAGAAGTGQAGSAGSAGSTGAAAITARTAGVTGGGAAASAAAAAAVATSGFGGLHGTWRQRKHDWTCGCCFNVNFWYRQKCNRCRAPKAELQASSESDWDKWELVVSQTSMV